jgi:hypothetical protein
MMDKRICVAFLHLLAMCMVSVVALAQQQEVYWNGPINGTTDAWAINSGFVVSNTFFVGTDAILENGLQFGAWLYPGDVLQSAEVSITSSEFGGIVYYDRTVNFTQSACSVNQFGLDVCTETSTNSFGDLSLRYGTYWLNLSNAVVNTGNPVYWDENSGPSLASENSVGTVPSESFAILGANCSSTNCNPPPSTPEPDSILLFGTGMLAVAGALALRLRF